MLGHDVWDPKVIQIETGGLIEAVKFATALSFREIAPIAAIEDT